MESVILIAQAALDTADRGPALLRLILLVVPYALLAGGLFVVALSMLRVRKRLNPLHDQTMRIHERSMQHMERIEARTDEMISLMKEIRDRLDSSH